MCPPETKTPFPLTEETAFSPSPPASSAVALLELGAAAARARIVAANVLQRITHRLVAVVAVRAVHVVVMVMIMVVVAIGTMYMGFLAHGCLTPG